MIITNYTPKISETKGIRPHVEQESISDEQRPSSYEADCEQNDWHTPVKTLLSLAVGNRRTYYLSTMKLKVTERIFRLTPISVPYIE